MTTSTTLRQIADRLRSTGLLRGGAADDTPEATVRSVALDSRRVERGALFCAVVGTRDDGHRHLAAAAGNGAVAATVEREDEHVALPQLVVGDGRLAAAHCAAELFRDPWDELTMIGVTGTNGKTTTVGILRHLLSRRSSAASIGTLGVVRPDGDVAPETSGLTTPDAVQIAQWLRALADQGADSAAVEVSSHALDQARVAATRFDAAVFTNLSRDHLDYHGTLERYREAKLRLLELLKPGRAAVVNADDPAWHDMGARVPRVVRFGTGVDPDVRAVDVRRTPAGTEWVLCASGGSAPVRLPLYGAHNVLNALAAAAALWSLGWDVAEIAAGLETVPQIRGRLEFVAGPPGSAAVLIDYAHTPDALARALEAVRPLVPGRLIVVFGAGGDRDVGKRAEMGRVAARGADLVVLTSDNPRTEDPEQILADIERGMGDAPRLRVRDRTEAIRTALQEATPRDLVLLAGKGHETYQIWGEERRPFDERAVVRSILQSRVEA